MIAAKVEKMEPSNLKRNLLRRSATIGQVCREFQITSRALRFYEQEGLIRPGRRGHERIYDHKDRARIGLIVRARAVGLSIRRIRALFDAYEESPVAQNALALELFEARLRELELERERVETAIDQLRAACERLTVQTMAAE